VDNPAYLDPSDSPDGMPAVRRLNHVPLYVLGGIACAIMLIIVMVAADKSKQAAPPAEDHGGNTDSYAQQAAGSAYGYIPAARTPTPFPTATPMDTSTPAPTPDAEAESRKKAFYESLYAPSAVADPLISQREQTAAQAAITPPPAPALAMPPLPGAAPTPMDPNSLSTYSGDKDRWKLNNRVEKAASKYILQTGWLIPALLISGMESQLPGYITAQVSQNVYDSPSGKSLLIPQGTRLFGEYASMISFGQSRIFVAWERLIFPNGNTMDIAAMPGVDGYGEAGFHDQTNNHFLTIFGSAILMSAISGATALSQPQQTFSNAPNLQSTLSAALGQQLGAATTSLLEKNLSVPPTLKIRQGYGFNVVVVKDLVFDRPYVVPNY
jgi:type IV secretory pathway VirB10-like protein